MARQQKFEPQAGVHPKNQFPHGSERHAALLQLRPVTKEEAETLSLQCGGFTLANRLMYGRFAKPDYLQATLEERVAILTKKPQFCQSEDRNKPNYGPPMFDPRESRSKKGAPTEAEIANAIEILERAKKALN